MTPKLIVISAPSGGGKTTISQEILKRHPGLVFSVSATTRARRIDEVDGRDYHFLRRAEFERLIDEEDTVEAYTLAMLYAPTWFTIRTM